MEPTVSMSFRRVVWLLPTSLALHELEEWNILEWYEAHWVNVDPVTMTPASVHVWLVFASVMAFLGTAAVLCSRHFPLLARTSLLPAFVIVVFGHAFAHIFWVWRFGGHAPGVVTSVFLIIPLTLFTLHSAHRDHMISRRYIAISLCAASMPLIAAIRAGNVVPPEGFRGFGSRPGSSVS